MKNIYAVRRPVVNAYLVRERDRRRVRELLAVAMVIVPLASGLLAYTWIHSQVIRLGYRIDELERDLEELTQLERQLRLEAAYLASPQRVAARAVDELGMRKPTTDRVVVLEELP